MNDSDNGELSCYYSDANYEEESPILGNYQATEEVQKNPRMDEECFTLQCC